MHHMMPVPIKSCLNGTLLERLTSNNLWNQFSWIPSLHLSPSATCSQLGFLYLEVCDLFAEQLKISPDLLSVLGKILESPEALQSACIPIQIVMDLPANRSFILEANVARNHFGSGSDTEKEELRRQDTCDETAVRSSQHYVQTLNRLSKAPPGGSNEWEDYPSRKNFSEDVHRRATPLVERHWRANVLGTTEEEEYQQNLEELTRLMREVWESGDENPPGF